MSYEASRKAIDELSLLHELAVSTLRERGELGVNAALLALKEMDSRLATLLNSFPLQEDME